MRLRCETRRFKVKSALLCAVLCVVVCSVLYSLDVFSLRNVTFPGRHYSPQRTYRVLMWHSFKHDFFDRIFGPDAVKECPFACNFSQDRAELDRSDVVVLQSFFKSFWKSLPRRRRAGQGWLLYAMEPPHRLPSNPSRLDELGINWTLSYRFDADVVHRHSFRTVRRRTSVERVFAPQPKARPVAWIVSNCESFSRRESYVRELQKVLPVDVFGRCGQRRCREHHFGCYREIAANYSFYLAFENSICKDYSTEKLFLPLLNSMVPVVMGGVNYSAVAPPGSYINFASFRTARELATYLLELQGNPEQYKRYFEWKKQYTIERPPFGCTACEQIHRLFTRPARKTSLYKYLWQEAGCTTWQGLLNRTWS